MGWKKIVFEAITQLLASPRLSPFKLDEKSNPLCLNQHCFPIPLIVAKSIPNRRRIKLTLTVTPFCYPLCRYSTKLSDALYPSTLPRLWGSKLYDSAHVKGKWGLEKTTNVVSDRVEAGNWVRKTPKSLLNSGASPKSRLPSWLCQIISGEA